MGCCESRGKCKNKIIVPDSFTNEDSQIQIDFSDNNQYQTAKWPSSNYNSHQPQNQVNSLENVFYQMENNAVPKTNKYALIKNENKNDSKLLTDIQLSSFDSNSSSGYNKNSNIIKYVTNNLNSTIKSNKDTNTNSNYNNIINQYTSVNSISIKQQSFTSIDDSNSIIAPPHIKTELKEDNNTYTNNNNFNLNEFMILSNKIVFFYFQIQNLVIHEQKYLLSLYPGLNIILSIEINDDKTTNTKIQFTQINDKNKGNNAYIPLISKNEKGIFHTIIIPYKISNENTIFKFSAKLDSYIKKQMLLLCKADIYINNIQENEGKKILLNQNVFLSNHNKKIANLIFEYSYITKDINKSIPYQKNEELLNEILLSFKQSKLFGTHSINYLNPLIYHNIIDINVFDNTNTNEIQSIESNFTTLSTLINDIKSYLLKNKDDLNTITQNINQCKTKYEIYLALNLILLHFQKREFNIEHHVIIKEFIYSVLIHLENKKHFNDNVFTPYLFKVFQEITFKTYSQKTNPISSPLTMLKRKDDQILINMFHLTFRYIINVQLSGMHDITLNAIYVLCKYLDNNNKHEIAIELENKTTQLIKIKDYFISILFTKKYITGLLDTYYKYCNFRGCAQSLTELFAKVIMMENVKLESKMIIMKFFLDENTVCKFVKKCLKIYECNGSIVMNLTNIYNKVFQCVISGKCDKESENIFVLFLKEVFTRQKVKDFLMLFKSKRNKTICESLTQFMKLYEQFNI